MNKSKLITNVLRTSLALAIFGSVYELNWMALFVSALTLILTFTPEIFSKRYKIYLPPFLQIFIIVFIYAGIFLGEAHSFYYWLWWWDSLLHLLAGIALGFAGFLILYILYKTGNFKANPFLIAVFAFCFAMALGGIWEIFEFSMDQFFGLNMQKARDISQISAIYCDTRLGVIDTMYDLTLDAIGAFTASTLGFFFLKGKKTFFFGNIVNDFEKGNKNLFKKNDE